MSFLDNKKSGLLQQQIQDQTSFKRSPKNLTKYLVVDSDKDIQNSMADFRKGIRNDVVDKLTNYNNFFDRKNYIKDEPKVEKIFTEKRQSSQDRNNPFFSIQNNLNKLSPNVCPNPEQPRELSQKQRQDQKLDLLKGISSFSSFKKNNRVDLSQKNSEIFQNDLKWNQKSEKSENLQQSEPGEINKEVYKISSLWPQSRSVSRNNRLDNFFEETPTKPQKYEPKLSDKLPLTSIQEARYELESASYLDVRTLPYSYIQELTKFVSAITQSLKKTNYYE